MKRCRSTACIIDTVARKSSWSRALAIALAVVAGVSLLSVVTAVVFVGQFVRKSVESTRVELEQELRRPVRLDKVRVDPLGGRVRIDGIGIGPSKDEPRDAPALSVEALRVDIGVLRTLSTLGRRPYVETIEVVRPNVTVLKRADGTLNWSEISQRLQEKKEPAAREKNGRSSRTRIGWGELRDGSIHFVEVGPEARKADVSNVHVVVKDAVIDQGGAVELEAALLQQRRNLKLEARFEKMGEAPSPATIRKLVLDLEPTPLAPLAPFLSALGAPESTPQQGVLSANVSFATADKDEQKGTGRVVLSGARFPEGQPFDGRVEFDLSTDRHAKQIAIRKMLVSAGEMMLSARARLQDLKKTPRVEDLDVRSKNLDFDRIAALYPPFKALTDPLVFEGPFSIETSGGGTRAVQHVELAIALTDASVRYEDKVYKPPGTPCALHAKLRTEQDVVTIERAVLGLSSWQMAVAGHIRSREGEATRYDLNMTTPNADAGGLLRLLPPVAAAFPGARDLGGTVAVAARFEGADRKTTAQGTLRLTDLDVRAPRARFGGGGIVRFDVERRNGGLAGRVRAEMSDLEAIYLDVVNKPKKTPLEIDVRFQRTANETRAEYNAKVASLVAEGNATLRGGPPAQPFTATIRAGPFGVRALLALFPSISESTVADVRFDDATTIRIDGVTGRPAALKVAIPHFAASVGHSNLRGAFTFANPDNPQIVFDGRSSYLDTDELLPRTAKAEARKGRKPSSPLAKADGRIALQVEQGKAFGVPYQQLDAKLRLEDGRATAEVLEVDTLGGHFSGGGSQIPVFADTGPYRLKGEVKSVQLHSLLARFGGDENLMTGGLSADFDLRAADTTPEALGRTLTGRLAGRVDQARFLPENGFAALVDRLQAAPGIGKMGRARAEQIGIWRLDDLSGALAFDNGAVVLQRPLTAITPQGSLSVHGKLRLAGPADLVATLDLRPEALEQVFREKIPLGKPLLIEFKIVGPLTNPSFAFGDLTPLVQPILQAYVKKGVQPELERSLRNLLGGSLSGGAPPKGDQGDETTTGNAGKKKPQPKKARKPPEQQKREEELMRGIKRLF